MTSNQLSYWKLKEEERSNRAREAETQRHNVVGESETQRHDIAEEQIKQLQNRLEERGLDIKDKQLLSQLAELYVTTGHLEWGQLPNEIREKISDQMGVDFDTDKANAWRSPGEFISGIYKEMKDIFSKGGAKIISSLF